MRTSMRPGSSFVLRTVHATQPQPWQNGGGVTRELARGAGWRVSLADVVADGPFSVFENLRRHSVVIGCAGLDLRCAGAHVALDPMRCASYNGGIAWQATLRAGATRAFNVMASEGRASAQVLVAPALAVAPVGGICLALCLAAGLSCIPDAAARVDLAPGDYIVFSPAVGAVHFEAAGAADFLAAPIGPSPLPSEPPPPH